MNVWVWCEYVCVSMMGTLVCACACICVCIHDRHISLSMCFLYIGKTPPTLWAHARLKYVVIQWRATCGWMWSSLLVTLHYVTTHCNTLQHAATHTEEATGNMRLHAKRVFVNDAATHCNPLQPTATHCNALRHAATQCNTHRARICSMKRRATCGYTWSGSSLMTSLLSCARAGSSLSRVLSTPRWYI